MNKIIVFIAVFVISFSCATKSSVQTSSKSKKDNINNLLNQWHRDVATFDFDAYFDKMTKDAIFVGTDASEVWSKAEFMSFSKPFFDKNQTWNFKPLERHVYFSKKGNTAWFDETLVTWMGVCRGSGVVIKTENGWKIQHYVLSLAIPNEDVQPIVKLKKERDSLYIAKYKN